MFSFLIKHTRGIEKEIVHQKRKILKRRLDCVVCVEMQQGGTERKRKV
jgi:hypothetical protein